MKRKGTFNARIESECRERIKKAVKTCADLYEWTGEFNAICAIGRIAAAVERQEFLSIKPDHIERWSRGFWKA